MAEVNASSSMQHKEVNDVLDAIVADLTALRASILAITDQLDDDAGVTDTDYAANCDPAALTTTTD